MKNHPWPERFRNAAAVMVAGIGTAFCTAAAAQEFPTHPITIVVGYSAGGANDVLARIVAEKMTASLGQTVVVVNKPGVASIIGAGFVAQQKPDGYTLLMGASGPMSFNPALYKTLPYAPDKDFVPISLVGTFPLVLLTQTANAETATVSALIRFVKAHPGGCNFSASAASFQLMTELFKRQAGIQCQYIPYKGSSDSIVAVGSGDATMTLVDIGPAIPAVAGQRVRAVAITAGSRVPALPSTPTMKQAGIDLDVELWSGLFAPAGTPAPIVRKLESAVRDAVASPDVQERIGALSITPKSSTSEELAARVKSEIRIWQQVAKDAGIQPN